MKQILALLCTCIAVQALAGPLLPLSCPDPTDIERVPGEYAWRSHNPMFEGYFAFPHVGRGESSKIEQFLEGRWVQLTDLGKSPGIIECDYAGNVAGEVIRFSLVSAQAVPQPSDYTWSCQYAPPFPSTQCVCQGDAGTCTFKKL